MFVAYEAVTGNRVDKKKQDDLNSAALSVVLLLTLYTFTGDLSK